MGPAQAAPDEKENDPDTERSAASGGRDPERRRGAGGEEREKLLRRGGPVEYVGGE